jgi:hypothetical protein
MDKVKRHSERGGSTQWRERHTQNEGEGICIESGKTDM